MNDSKFINSSSSAPPLKMFPPKNLTRVIQSSIATFWKRSLDEKLPGHKSMNNFDSLQISIAGFKFIFIYLFLSTEPQWQSEYSTFSPSNIFFSFSFLFFVSTQNKRTLSAIRQRTLTVRCSLYRFTVHVYTHKEIVHHHYYISDLHPPTSWKGQSECLKNNHFWRFNLHTV